MIIIPIGVQCTNATFKKRIKKTSETLPFDWMLSNPKFIYEMLVLLLKVNCDIDELVTQHFFYIEDTVNVEKLEHYDTCPDGKALLNRKYNVVFPHDTNDQVSIDKYKRRFERLKNLILNYPETLYFVYSSQASKKRGNFLIDGKMVVTEVYHYLTKIYELIGEYRENYKVIVYDTVLNENTNALNPNIILYKLNRCNSWTMVLAQMMKYTDIYV